MILALRTDSPTAELYLLDQTGEIVAHDIWLAERRLANKLLPRIDRFLADQGKQLTQLTGIVVYTGSGSFTGLRIGTTVANALAYSLGIPVAAAEGEKWIDQSIPTLYQAKSGKFVVPKYSSPPNIT